MNLTDRDLEKWLRAACPPIEPAPPLRRLVLAAAPRRRPAARVLRFVVPFAAGVLCVLAAQRQSFPLVPEMARESLTTVSDTGVRDSRAVPAGIFERIADRAPAAAAEREAAPAPVEVAAASVPRIS